MSGVYTNIARKRIEQSHEASHAPQKTTDPLNHSVDKKEHLQEEKDPSRVTLSNQNAVPSLSVPEKEEKTKIQFASTLASKTALWYDERIHDQRFRVSTAPSRTSFACP